MEDLLVLNPHLTREELMRGVEFEADGCTLRSWSFGDKSLTGSRICLSGGLPESFGDLTLSGDLNLVGNQLYTLPESFGSITVGGFLNLNSNRLSTLPESFGSITVGGYLDLGNNRGSATFPKSFPNVKGAKPVTRRKKR